MTTTPEQNTPEQNTPGPSTPTRTSRRRPLAIAVGITTLALAGAAFVSLPNTAVAQDARGQVDPAERAAHMAEMAEQFGVDPDVLSATMEALRADLAEQRRAATDAALEELGVDPDVLSATMEALRADHAEQRRAAMVAALEELGVDPDVLAQHQAERRAERQAAHGGERGSQQHRGGFGMRG